MQCQIPICQKEVSGEGHTHGLGDNIHTITICDECEEKRKDFRPDYEDVGEENKQFVWVWKKTVYADFIDTTSCPQCQREAHLEDMWYGERRRIVCSECGLHYNTALLKPVYLHEMEIPDGKGGKAKVRPGDAVDLLPVSLLEERGGWSLQHSAQDDYNFHIRWLGKGPYTVTHIGLWPCGRAMLYLKTATSSGAGSYAGSFMVVNK